MLGSGRRLRRAGVGRARCLSAARRAGGRARRRRRGAAAGGPRRLTARPPRTSARGSSAGPGHRPRRAGRATELRSAPPSRGSSPGTFGLPTMPNLPRDSRDAVAPPSPASAAAVAASGRLVDLDHPRPVRRLPQAVLGRLLEQADDHPDAPRRRLGPRREPVGQHDHDRRPRVTAPPPRRSRRPCRYHPRRPAAAGRPGWRAAPPARRCRPRAPRHCDCASPTRVSTASISDSARPSSSSLIEFDVSQTIAISGTGRCIDGSSRSGLDSARRDGRR